MHTQAFFPSSPLSNAPREFRLLDIRVDNISWMSAVHRILAPHHAERCRLVYFVNAHCVNVSARDAAYRAALREADLVLPDGTGVRWGANRENVALRENLNGTDLFPDLCEKAAQDGLSIFLLGGEPGIAKAAAENMQSRYPALRVAGTQDGFFAPESEAELIDRINRSGADVLFVGMGVPLQELWIQRHARSLKVRSALAVGGLFDYYSGKVKRAPLLFRRLGQEWVWRLMQEPVRLARRYLLGNAIYLWSIVRASKPSETPSRFAYLARAVLVWQFKWEAARGTRRAAMQRFMDLALVIPGLVALSPLFGLLALLIRMDSPGSPFFSQERIGRFGRPFRFYKFRSMYIDAEERRKQLEAANEMDGGVLFKMREDPRITRVGRFLRRTSLDELPQLWNVLRGDMSLVGPRPALPDEVRQYSAADRRRLRGLPGITCSWQVSGRSDIPFDQQVELDSRFLHNPSLGTYLQLLFKTIPAVLSGRGAY